MRQLLINVKPFGLSPCNRPDMAENEIYDYFLTNLSTGTSFIIIFNLLH